MMNRKAAGGGGSGPQDFYDSWPEVFFVLILALGFIVSLLSKSALFVYIIMFFSGVVIGRLWYMSRHGQQFPLFIISIGFLLGVIAGSLIFHSEARWGIITAFYLIGVWISIWVHKRGMF